MGGRNCYWLFVIMRGCGRRYAILDQVYIEVVRPGSVSACYVHATTAEACFATSALVLQLVEISV